MMPFYYDHRMHRFPSSNRPSSLGLSNFSRSALFTESRFRHLLEQDPTIKDKAQALAFVKFIVSKNGTDKMETLCSLTASLYGLQAVQSAISLEISYEFARQTVIPLIGFVGEDERMMLGSARSITAFKLLRAIYQTPRHVFEALIGFAIDRKFSEEEAFKLGWFVLQIVKSGDETPLEARQNNLVANLARHLASNSFPGAKNVSEQISNLLGKIYAEKTAANCQFQLEGMDSLRKRQPGWRHDNDKADFRSIAIHPTVEEVTCKEPDFLPQTSEIFQPEKGVAHYLDWTFRLLRYDIVQSVREEIDLLLTGKTPTDATSGKLLDRLRSRSVKIVSFDCLSFDHSNGIAFRMAFQEPAQISAGKLVKKEDYWERKRKFLMESSLLALVRNGRDLLCLTVVDSREMKQLTQVGQAPSINVIPVGYNANRLLLTELGKLQYNLEAVQLSASFFAYAPILERLQQLSNVPFKEEILQMTKTTKNPGYYSEENCPTERAFYNRLTLDNPFTSRRALFQSSRITFADMLDSLRSRTDLSPYLGLKKPLVLDPSQKEAVTLSLKRRVALIQGPPGTGKSFCGAVISKIIHDFSKERILVVCYTNHALDQFLENLLDFDLPESSVVRLGGMERMSERIAKFAIGNLLNKDEGCNSDRRIIAQLHARMEGIEAKINERMSHIYYWANTNRRQDFLSQTPRHFAAAFQMPAVEEGFQMVGKTGDPLGPYYLWQRWTKGQNRGVIDKFYPLQIDDLANDAWSLPSNERAKLINEWRQELMRSDVDAVERLILEFNELAKQLHEAYNESRRVFLTKKRIIGCTTTGAAKYAKELEAVGAGVLIMEEAGEILEPHVITSMASNCKHLIMIGDHKQLRPKLNVYQLTAESGSPFEFNRSLFERLVRNNLPFTTLNLQHRMRPQFSHLVRCLTYPELKDAEKVKNYANLMGTPSNLIFIQHEHEEGASSSDAKQLLALSTEDCMSKVNAHEVAMVAKICQYLLGQGYKGDQLVVLTPYLGQLQAIRDALSKQVIEVDLSDRDVADLNNHGLGGDCLSRPGQKQGGDEKKTTKKRAVIRVATVDNYQGEEADIVIASLVRSNNDGIVGFVGEPERVNVLLSRARIGMILIGNMRTFEKAKSTRARELWSQLLQMLNEKQAIFAGFPAFCSVHDRSFILACPDDFAKFTPDGGCDSKCDKMLVCGRHKCPKKCHRIPADHNLIDCQVLVKAPCPTWLNHMVMLPCHLSNDCGSIATRCTQQVEVVCPSRGHSFRLPCNVASKSDLIAKKCTTEVQVTCKKGHPVIIPCCKSENPDFIASYCQTLVKVMCESDHAFSVPCAKSDDVSFIAKQCKVAIEINCLAGLHRRAVLCCDSRLPCEECAAAEREKNIASRRSNVRRGRKQANTMF